MRPGEARQVWSGGMGFVSARRVELGHGRSVGACWLQAWLGEEGSGSARQVGQGEVC